MKLQANGLTVEINKGDKFDMMFEARALTNHGKPYMEKLEAKKVGRVKGELQATWYIFRSTYKDLKGKEVITNPEDGYNQKQFFKPFENGNGFKIIDADTFEHYSDNKLSYTAKRIR
jgi:hypothetical protein